MEVFVARHPVFDRGKEVYGYSLQFRSGFETYYEALSAERRNLDFMAFVNFQELTEGKFAFIDFAPSLLLDEFPGLFDSRQTVAGVAAEAGSDQRVVERCRELRREGYCIAVRDRKPEEFPEGMLEVANIVSVDFAALDESGRARAAEVGKGRDLSLLAENVETVEDFEQATELGYTLFRGNFISKPIIRPGRDIPANKLNYFRLLREINSPWLSYDEIAAVVEQDVALTYSLLRFINSAWFGLRYEVKSVKHAFVLLGPKETKRWITLVAIRKTGEDKPRELLLRSLTRAKACEELARLTELKTETSELFLTGMFSMIDALLDKPMGEILDELPLKKEIKQALNGQPSPYRAVYDTVITYEQGDWDAFTHAVDAAKLDEQQIPDLMRKALAWARQAIRGL